MAQESDVWTAYYNADTTLIGFKDAVGNVRIPAKFTMFAHASKFRHIITVGERKGDSLKSYYLTKAGRVVGRDSLYFFDNTPDCESEGFIRFADDRSERVGMFDRDGNVVISATYNWLSNVRNGMIIALKGADKVYDDPGREHYYWKSGRSMLIDTADNVLIDSFTGTEILDFYSAQASLQPGIDTVRRYFRRPDGTYLSFVDHQLEFRNWLDRLLNDLSLASLLDATFVEVTIDEPDDWVKKPGKQYVASNYERINKKLLSIKNKKDRWWLYEGGLNKFIYTDPKTYGKYYNDCGESKYWKYPVLSIVINNKKGQDHFDFLRTDEGYKLISVSFAR
ncbi:MAG: hypothetical protein EOP56_06120 [Sphingobacteriales bacterium]|nr:MAG: hypothetical protein EOP56_06120 [Sphingobacteriales bacterium]